MVPKMDVFDCLTLLLQEGGRDQGQTIHFKLCQISSCDEVAAKFFDSTKVGDTVERCSRASARHFD